MTDKQHSGTLLQDDQPLPAFRRLVILVPNADLDEIRLATSHPINDVAIQEKASCCSHR